MIACNSDWHVLCGMQRGLAIDSERAEDAAGSRKSNARTLSNRIMAAFGDANRDAKAATRHDSSHRILGAGSRRTRCGVENGARRSRKSSSSSTGELRKKLAIGVSIQIRSANR